MFNLLVNIGGWSEPRGTMLASMTFEGTGSSLAQAFRGPDGRVDLAKAIQLPTVFAEETTPLNQEIARVGQITHARLSGRDIELQFSFDPLVRPIPNAVLAEMGIELGIDAWEFSRTHWAIKEADFFRSLLRHSRASRSLPRVFRINDPEVTDPVLVSAMMPFDASFSPVYAAIRGAAEDSGLRCRRADDIWENPSIIQDVVALIDRARIVVCDCTNRNPNVFYEIGIAHTLGREVVLITQSNADVPFDLRHLRYVRYLNNGEGLRDLKQALTHRFQDIA